jgi:hypothetical protein
VSTHVVFDVRPEERAELLAGLNIKALDQLAVPKPEPTNAAQKHRARLGELGERQRLTSMYTYCLYERRDVTLAQAWAFAAHGCRGRRVAA